MFDTTRRKTTIFWLCTLLLVLVLALAKAPVFLVFLALVVQAGRPSRVLDHVRCGRAPGQPCGVRALLPRCSDRRERLVLGKLHPVRSADDHPLLPGVALQAVPRSLQARRDVHWCVSGWAPPPARRRRRGRGHVPCRVGLLVSAHPAPTRMLSRRTLSPGRAAPPVVGEGAGAHGLRLRLQ